MSATLAPGLPRQAMPSQRQRQPVPAGPLANVLVPGLLSAGGISCSLMLLPFEAGALTLLHGAASFACVLLSLHGKVFKGQGTGDVSRIDYCSTPAPLELLKVCKHAAAVNEALTATLRHLHSATSG